MVYALYFRPEAERDGLFITDEVTQILGDKAVAAHAIPSVTGKLTTNPVIAAAVGKGVPLYGFIRRRRGTASGEGFPLLSNFLPFFFDKLEKFE